MICGPCNKVMVEAHMLKNYTANFSGGSEKKASPTVIFKGEWPGESIRGGNK